MRTLYRLNIIFIALALSSCASINQSAAPSKAIDKSPASLVEKKPHKNPLTISLHKKSHQTNKAYTVVGQETVSKYNKGGIKRQEAHLRDTMREIAAAMGGDAVIDIKHDGKTITGTVVAFHKDTSHANDI